MKFTNLHHHTTFSMLDGYGTPKQLVERLTELGQDSIAITDHGAAYGHPPFNKAFKGTDLHLIYGVEFYIRHDLEKERGYYHITVLAKTSEGYHNLLRLLNLSFLKEQFYYKPRITFDQLKEYSKGLIILSGCFSDGYLVKNPAGVEWFLKHFKKQELYIEIQPFPDLQEPWDRLTSLAKSKGIPAVVTFDSHYLRPEDQPTHSLMLAINTNKPMSDPDRLKMDFPLWIPSVEEALQRCRAMGGAFKSESLTLTHKIAQSCSVDLPKTKVISLGAKIGKIKAACEKRLKELGRDKDKVYTERLKYELRLIEEKGFTDYFTIIWDLMKWARKRMLCGPGRGSSAGSLVCYLIGITNIDPLEHDLLFERFIDMNRSDLPDIDLDFPAGYRDQVVGYLKRKYGEDKTAQLVTFNTFKPRACISDSARVLRIGMWEVKEAMSQIVERSSGDARADSCLADSVEQYDKLKAFITKHPEIQPAIGLEGQVRQLGKHAAAVAIADSPIGDIGFVNQNGVLSIDKYCAEAHGILKIDVLGLETLDILMDICNEVGMDFRELYDLPLDDPLTYEKVFTPSRLYGVFQFEGLSVRQMCEGIKPTGFPELSHCTALGRPGPLNAKTHIEYMRRKAGIYTGVGQNPESHLHSAKGMAAGNSESYKENPWTAPFTKDTLGLIIYQEQVMQVVRHIGNFSWADTGTIRKGMSKSLGAEFFNKFRGQFVEGAATHGMSEQEATELFNSVYSFGSWAFNKSHSVSYALVSYWAGYMKAHYPAQFYARVLRGKTEEHEIVPVLKEYGGKVVPVDINLSQGDFTATPDGTLVGGFSNIKGIGPAAVAKIEALRPFTDLEDFKKRCPKGIASKILGALDGGLPWATWTSFKNKCSKAIKKIELSMPLQEFKSIHDQPIEITALALGRVLHINLKDHNEEKKIEKRGFKMQGDTEYIVLRVEDDEYNLYYICFDKTYTKSHKQELLGLKDKVCMFKVQCYPGGLILGKKIKILQEDN